MEAFGIEVDCMLDAVRAVGGNNAEKDFIEILNQVKGKTQHDKG